MSESTTGSTTGSTTETPNRSTGGSSVPSFQELGYEEARDALVDVVRRLEAGGVTLEESLALWERGEALATRCEQWLAGARAKVEGGSAAEPAT